MRETFHRVYARAAIPKAQEGQDGVRRRIRKVSTSSVTYYEIHTSQLTGAPLSVCQAFLVFTNRRPGLRLESGLNM
jgi:hypothetical protein